MSNRKFKNKSGDTFEWDETEEVRIALENLHKKIYDLEKEHVEKGGDYGVGK
jgi:hypothetical protein